MSQVHWYARPLPNLATAACGALLVVAFWSLGARSLEPFVAGASVGLLDGILGFLGRRQSLPYLRNAANFGAATFAYLQSPWTRARNMITVACLVILGVVIARQLEQPAHYSAMTLFASFATVSFLFRALILAPWGGPSQLPSNTALERTREG